MIDEKACAVVRTALRTLLAGFAEEPLFDLREHDPQSRLLHEIRARLEPARVPVRLRAHGGERHRYCAPFSTSRVHSELKLGTEKLDLVVLRGSQDVELVVYPAGALDVVASVRGEDLVVVLELKAAPSSTQGPTFVGDLLRLQRITERHPDCFGFFALFDKSQHLGGAESRVAPRWDWLERLIDRPDGRVEAHFLDNAGRPAARRGVVR